MISSNEQQQLINRPAFIDIKRVLLLRMKSFHIKSLYLCVIRPSLALFTTDNTNNTKKTLRQTFSSNAGRIEQQQRKIRMFET